MMASLNPSDAPALPSTLLNGSASISKLQRYTYVTDKRIGGKQSESVVSGSATAAYAPPPVPTPESSSETQQQQQSSSMAEALFQTFVSELREFITGVHQLSDRSGVDRLLSHSKHLQTQIVRLRDTHTTQLTRMQCALSIYSILFEWSFIDCLFSYLEKSTKYSPLNLFTKNTNNVR